MSEFNREKFSKMTSSEASKYQLNDEEINRLINATKDLRDRLVVEMLVYLGARRGEIVLVRRLDVDLEKNRVRVPTLKRKGDPYLFLRTVPIISESFKRDLEYYLKITDLQFKPSQYEKLLRHSTNRYGDGLTTCRVNQILQKVAEKANVTSPNPNRKHLNPHCLRHSYVRNARKRGMDIKAISQIVGHQSVSVTYDVYGSFSDEELAEESKKLIGYGEQ